MGLGIDSWPFLLQMGVMFYGNVRILAVGTLSMSNGGKMIIIVM